MRRVAGLGCGRDPKGLQQQIAHPIEQVDDGLREKIEEPHRGCQEQRDRPRAGDGEALRGQLAHHHVQHGDDPEGHRDRQAHARDGGGVAEERLEQVVEDGFPHHAETQARERDPELAGGEVGVDVVHRVADRARPRLAVAQELVDLGGP